ncbi:class I SAM-dependent methyltransferase [Amycolatopsis rhabdoformis]|uniref:Class I SAM-dependent methyltransferase n=1 Tax=Amycolatopsis rhabdoformis TaxID=1448059 RepID=A0ABZ1IHB4_9PSEU|nr:class I SAM-dependent methyltransferase [Amycolatopsis rhabdoformis]WSE33048.1 class I SAM-dependent methyltransferase [Amycolatopsis rhabdoformis]
MTDLDTHYATGLSRAAIEQALVAAGKDLDHLVPADLATLEDFHTMGRLATGALADLAAVTPGDTVLDAGSGIGGTARFLADRHGCRVSTVDLTAEYCDTARWLNGLVGLPAIDVRHGDVTELPFPDAAFTVVFSQHVQMNVADKHALYREARRVLAPGGRLALWDVTAGSAQALDYPLPWADEPAHSHLAAPGELREAVESAGFTVSHWADLTETAAGVMQAVQAQPPNPLGLHVFVPGFATKGAHLTQALADGRLRVVQAVAIA